MKTEPVALPRIPISRPYLSSDEADAVRDVLMTGWIAMGPQTKRFEEVVSERLGVTAIATSSATSAMHLSLVAWGIGPGDEVVVPALTFAATAHAVVQAGATPVFADIDPRTMTLAPAAAEAAVTSRTRALLPVHLHGMPADLDALQAIADRHGLKLLEDAACALGSTYRGRPVGSIGDAGAFSFHPRKILTMGEGGILSSRDSDLLAQASCQRNHGASVNAYDRHRAGVGVYPPFPYVGFNYRLTDIQATLGVSQMAKLDEILALRAGQAERYTGSLAGLDGLVLPEVPDDRVNAWQAYVVRVAAEAPVTVDEFRDALAARNIVVVQASQLVPGLECYRDRSGYVDGRWPEAERADREGLAIPLFAGLEEAEQTRVIDAIREVWG